MTATKATYRYYNFDRLWKFFPLRRSTKEGLKKILFTVFPFVFRRWDIYLNWKNARIYRHRNLKITKLEFWRRLFYNSYPIQLTRGTSSSLSNNAPGKLAVVVHVFYTDIFDEILNLLSQAHISKTSLYLTGPQHIIDTYKNRIPENLLPVYFLPIKNHGRDILPFLKVLPRVFDDGHQLVLKLHTKGSNHLHRSIHWRKHLFAKLIGKGTIDRAIEIFGENENIGIIGPSRNILPMYNYYGSNAEIVEILSRRMGVDDALLGDLNFVAGSMFYARKEALLPILELGLSDADFEKENGQVDGTMAHAIERLFPVGLIAAKLQLADTDYTHKNPVLKVNKNHYFSS